MVRTRALAAVLACALGAGVPAGAQEMLAPNVGHRLAPLEFADQGGTTHRLNWSEAGPRATVVFFFEPGCSDCFREFVFFDTLQRLAQGLPLEVYAVEASGQEGAEVEQTIGGFLRIFRQPAFGVVADPAYRLSGTFNVARVPSTFLMEGHGMIVSRKEGFDSFHAIDLARKLERLLGVEKGRFSPALATLEVTPQAEARFERAIEGQRRAVDSGSAYAQPLAAGSVVPPFAYSDLAGRSFAWSPDAAGRRATVVFFWGALCQPCIREMAYLGRLAAAAGDRLGVIAIEGNGLPAERVSLVMERYRKHNPPPAFPLVVDPQRLLSSLFGVGGSLPQTFVIGADGRVLHQTDQFVQGGESALAAMIAEAIDLAPGALAEQAARAEAPRAAGEAPSIVSEKQTRFAASLVQAESLYRNWQYAAAVPYYLRCLEIEPAHVGVRERLADSYERLGQTEKALEEWLQVLRLDPNHVAAAVRVKKLRAQTEGAGPQGR